MRYLLILLAASVCIPASAQRVFRASPIDQEQNERLDKLEEQVRQLATSTQSLPEKMVAVTQPATQPVVQPSNRYSSDELQSMVRSMRPGGWQGPVYADVARGYERQHLLRDHGYKPEQIAGLSHSDLLILHDLSHGGKIHATRNAAPTILPNHSVGSVQRSYAGPIVNRNVTRQFIQPVNSGCANGQCSTQPTRTQRYGILGWRR